MQIEYQSDVGRRRNTNQDYASVFTNQEGIKLAILADGMGDYFLMANFDTIDEVNEFFSYCLERITPSEFKKM